MELNKKDILTILSQLPFPPNSFWIVMGGALVLHGIRDTTRDIDIGCTNELFELLKSTGYNVRISRSGQECIDYCDIVHIYREWKADSFVIIDHIPVVDLLSIIKDKKALGRPKDLADIDLIQEFLKNI